MSYKNIKPSTDKTHFLRNGVSIFNKFFMEVLPFHEPGLAPVKDNSGSYHINEYGEPLYDQRYERTFGFYYHRASVCINNQYFHIDTQGRKIGKETYAWTGNFQEELCCVRDFNNQYFYINLQGYPISTTRYRYAGDYREGIACVQGDDGKFFHIMPSGEKVNDKTFVQLGVFHKGFATAKDENGWFHINHEGEALYAERYQYLEPFYNGVALAFTSMTCGCIINEQGEILAVL